MPLSIWQCIRIGFRYVIPGAAVNVDVNETGRQDSVPEINYATTFWSSAKRARTDFNDGAVVHQQQRLFNPLQWCEQRCGSQDDHEMNGPANGNSFYRKS